MYCCCVRKKQTKIRTSSEILGEFGFTVDRWMSRGRVAKIRKRNTSFVCRIATSAAAAEKERNVLHALVGCKHVPLVVAVNAMPQCVLYTYIPGVDLHQVAVSSHGVLATTLQHYFERIASAIAFAHARGGAHLDIKPENIVIRNDGVPVLIDWEYAIRVANEFELVQLSSKRGTAHYMAPEMQSEAKAGCPSDIWSLAKTYEACTKATLTVPENPASRPTIENLFPSWSLKFI